MPCRLTWSEIATICPGRKSAAIPPAAFVDDERADPERSQHAHAEDDAIGADSFVQVRPALHHDDRSTLERPEHEHARVPDGRRHRPARDLRVGDRDRVRQLVGEPTEPAPEDDADARLDSGLLSNAGDRVLDALTDAHV